VGELTTHVHSACPLCGGTLALRYDDIPDRLGTSPGGYRLDECDGCGLGLINPAPSGDLSSFYPDHYLSQEEDGGSESALSRLERTYRYDQYRFDFALLRRATGLDIGSAASYVDIGCGSGERVTYAHGRGCGRAVGVDRYEFGKAASRRDVELVTSEVVDFRPVERFAVVSMFHVLEHVEDPVGILRHLRENVVADDGVLVVQVPNYRVLERRIFGRRWFGLDAPRHLFQFDRWTVRRALEASGWEVTAGYRVNAPLHPVTLVPSAFPALDPQRIWVGTGSPAGRLVKQLLWAAVTLCAIPVAAVQNLARNASMLTVVARPAASAQR
jgi:SAM-dependent methyltransferase